MPKKIETGESCGVGKIRGAVLPAVLKLYTITTGAQIPAPRTHTNMLYTDIKEHHNIRIIRILVDKIMFDNYEDVFNKIKIAVSDEHSQIVLDLGRVTFMDSLSIGMLVPLQLYTRRFGGDLVVAALADDIARLFDILNLDKIIAMYDDTDQAVRALESGGAQ